MVSRLMRAAARQALLGLAATAASLPLLLLLSRTLGLGMPPETGVALLGGSVVLGFAGGGLLGALFARAGGRTSLGKVRLAAALAGLVWGAFLCSVALPLYLDDALDDATSAGTEQALARVGTVLDRPAGAMGQATDLAGKLVEEGAPRVPALALLGWTLLGPALAGPLEARRPKDRRPA